MNSPFRPVLSRIMIGVGIVVGILWSPDGKQIAFDSRPKDHSEIYVVDSTGGPSRQITFGDADAIVPAFSRDGRSIYFARLRQAGSDLWRVAASGGTPVIAIAQAMCVQESVDGRTLYYTKVTDKEMAIYSRPTVGGDEALLFRETGDNTGNHNPFLVFEDGIYYRRRIPGTRGHDLMFYDFARRSSNLVVHLPFGYWREHFSVSVDRTYLLIRRAEQQNNIMLLENFR